MTSRKKNQAPLSTVQNVYDQSNRVETSRVLRQLAKFGVEGRIAAELFRAQKSSSRAKVYRGDYRDLAYGKKGSTLMKLCDLFQSAKHGLTWGWGIDEDAHNPHVLYIELPIGQVSFHAPVRGAGPDYAGDWDGLKVSAERIIAYCQHILDTNGNTNWTHVPLPTFTPAVGEVGSKSRDDIAIHTDSEWDRSYEVERAKEQAEVARAFQQPAISALLTKARLKSGRWSVKRAEVLSAHLKCPSHAGHRGNVKRIEIAELLRCNGFAVSHIATSYFRQIRDRDLEAAETTNE